MGLSGKSGAELLMVMVGKGAGGGGKEPLAGPGGASTRFHSVKAGRTTFELFTMQSGQAPEVWADGERVRVGGQTIAFDGQKLIVQ